jgi:uncharacterized protein YraI
MSFVRIAASAAIFTLLSAVCATARPVTTTADTNLRKAPGTDSPSLTLIPKGTTVEVGTCSNGWCQTSLDGQDGFAFAPNLGMAPARRPPPGPVVAEEEETVEEGGPPPVIYAQRPSYYAERPAYVAGPPAYYGYRPYSYYGYGPYYGYGWGWGRRWW